MGFRDIGMFNLALLKRQAWRVLQDPSSLSAGMLKAVYFPDGEFLDAAVGNSPSREWHAIVEGKEVLSQGLIRCIGTGEKTNIWSMNWLPRGSLLRPLACTQANPPQWVNELIDPSTATWDQSKLQTFFTPMDREIICNIPLSMRRQEDFWAWHYEKKGVFSVRSTYRMLVNTKAHMTAWLENKTSRSDTREAESWLSGSVRFQQKSEYFCGD
jgi:hypothetical protein